MLSIVAYRMDFGDGDGHKWFGGVLDGTGPVADSAQDGSAGAFASREDALEWAKNRKRQMTDAE